MNIDFLKDLGGREWIVDDKHRVYFNNLDELFGLECCFFNSGYVRCATLDGEKISNSRANEIHSCLNEAKLWYDVIAGKWGFSIRDCRDFKGREMGEYIIDEINSRLEYMLAGCSVL